MEFRKEFSTLYREWTLFRFRFLNSLDYIKYLRKPTREIVREMQARVSGSESFASTPRATRKSRCKVYLHVYRVQTRSMRMFTWIIKPEQADRKGNTLDASVFGLCTSKVFMFFRSN